MKKQRQQSTKTAKPLTVTLKVQFTLGGERKQIEAEVPKGPTHIRIMLPLVQALADTVVDQAVKEVEAKGEKISCQKGCGACCRQLVPITEVEARMIRDLIAEMPEPRRSVIRERFAEARGRLEQAGLLEQLLAPETVADDGPRALGLEYFRVGVACPFLEEESCSIYRDRPIACREYLVTSPAENCKTPSAETVHCVPMPVKVSRALADIGEDRSQRLAKWVPLIVASEWAEKHPTEPPSRPGPELFRELFEGLSGKRMPASPE